MRVGLKYHIKYPNAEEISGRAMKRLKSHGVDCEELRFEQTNDPPDINRDDLKKKLTGLDLLLSIGGDGTFLSTARLASTADVPVFGINAGRFGFLTEATCDELDTVITRLVSGDYRVEERRIISAAFMHNGKQKQYIGLNDVIIHRQALSRILSLETYLGDKYIATYEGDGLILATTTGSTAYNLSAGGSIVHPDVDCLIITPICPHTLNIRPMIVPPTSKLKIIPRFSGIPTDVAITFDGQCSENVNEEEPIYAGYSDLKCKLVRIKDEDFFSLIRRKLHWGFVVR